MSSDAPLPPRANPELFGHEAVEAMLDASLRSGRMPHAWMFTGPAGIGKATLAFRFARRILAGPAAGGGLAIDPTAPLFRRIAAGGHPDLLTIERGEKRDLPVEEIRRIDPFLRLTGAETPWRVAIVDDAETMNRNAANALLKILEEPPSRAVLLLVCANPGLLPATIRSRCRTVVLAPLPDAVVGEGLRRAFPDLDPATRQVTAQLAEGSLGRALTFAAEGGVETFATVLRLFGTLRTSELMKIVESHGGTDVAAWRRLTEILPWWMERTARALTAGTAPVPLTEADAAAQRRIASLFAGPGGLDRWLALWDKTRRLFQQADHANLDRKQVLLQAFLGIGRACEA